MSPLHVPQQDLYGQRSFISRASGLFIHLYLSQSPIRSPPTKNGENIWSPSTEPHVDRKLHIIGCSLVPQGYRVWHCNLYPSAMHPSARYRPSGLGRTKPHKAACVVATLIRLYHPQLLPPPMWPRVEQSMNPRYPNVRTMGWIYGRLDHFRFG